MGKIKDLTGQKFGRLTVVEFAEIRKRSAYWRCKCICGSQKIVAGYHLLSGAIQSCGCLWAEVVKKNRLHSAKVYSAWHGIKRRCFDPNNKAYKNYGGRGITMFEDWINDFQAFYDYVSKLPHFGEAGYSLDRIDNDGNYEPDNLRWATVYEQLRNRRNNRIVEYNGETMCLKDAARKSGISYNTLCWRYEHGDTGERLFRPVDTKFSNKK